jgi:hypothetical protein
VGPSWLFKLIDYVSVPFRVPGVRFLFSAPALFVHRKTLIHAVCFRGLQSLVPDARPLLPVKDDFVTIGIRFNDAVIEYAPTRHEARAVITVGTLHVGTNVMPLVAERHVSINARDLRLWLLANAAWAAREPRCRHGTASDHLAVRLPL